MGEPNYDELDPWIRDKVRAINEAGFETTDSGDGVSKPADWYESGCAIPFPHVVVSTTSATMLIDAHRLAGVVGPTWTVEASYATHDGIAHLFARVLDARELSTPEGSTR